MSDRTSESEPSRTPIPSDSNSPDRILRTRRTRRTDGDRSDVGLSGSFAERADARSEDPSTVEPNRASSAGEPPTTGLCPTCRTTQRLTPFGVIWGHHSNRMRWSGQRWFRVQCWGSGRAPAVSSVVPHVGADR